jgi:SAM-dependent methyltransferase
MNAHPTSAVEQHNFEIQRNRAVWARKPLLQSVYRDFHRMIASRLDPRIPGPVVELGSGMGQIKEVIPQCVTTDLFPNPWLDRRENAYALTFADGEVSHLILFDVWHHLRYPGTALREFHRVLAPRGRLIILDPAASWIGRLVYRFFHHESLRLSDRLVWDAPESFSAKDLDYYTSQGSASRIFWWGEHSEKLHDWTIREVLPLAAFEYFATGGFSGPQIGGSFFHRLLRRLDSIIMRWPRASAARLLIVLEKKLP